jgi:riboflavin kinase/FMN adenylyltransferase
MQTVFGLDQFTPGWRSSTVCIGVFDGVHLGHRAIISEARDIARKSGCPAVVLTFDRHPMALLRPDRCPKMILAPHAKLSKIGAMNVDAAVIAVFDKSFSEQSPEEFLENILQEKLRAEKVVVGHDFAFGHNRAGTPEWLAERISTVVLGPIERDGRRVSSTEIRADIETGKVAEAAELLGSSFALSGTVEKGNQLGRKLGVPTANVAPSFDQVVPRDGIYAGFAAVERNRYMAAISVGSRPAVSGAGFAIEAHLLDFDDRELYGRAIEVEFTMRLRDELWFEDQDALVRQMRQDLDEARAVLSHA